MDRSDTPVLCAVAVGNSRLRAGRFSAGGLVDSGAVAADDDAAIRELLTAMIDGQARVLAIASAAPAHTERVERLAADAAHDARLVRVGRDLPIPINRALDDESTVGHDRLLAALGAYRTANQACVVVDAGTAVTIDFVDGEGTFQGGAIAPGPTLMLDALHGRATHLPQLEFKPPDPRRGVFGKDTTHAMLLGVAAALRGVFRERLDSYAEAYGAYPQVVATGGDAALLEETGLVDHIVPDLVLMGIAAAFESALRAEADGLDDNPADGPDAHG